MPAAIYTGVADRPTPSTDQLFAVGVKAHHEPDKEITKYYVPANGVVIGKTAKNTMITSANGAKRRARHNPVYQVTGSAVDAVDAKAFDLATDWRVFGVAYDGVDVGNMRNAKEHPDSCGRFSVIFAGAATLSAPREVTQNSSMGYQDATIGTVVVVNPFEQGDYQFRGDPENFQPIGFGYIPRDDWLAMLHTPSNANVNACWNAAFGATDKYTGGSEVLASASDIQKYATLAKLKLGYLLDTGGTHRNEIRVQLALNYGYFRVTGSTNITASMGDMAPSAALSSAPTSSPVAAAFLDCVEASPPVSANDGCPEGSVLGVIAHAVGGVVGTVDTSVVSPTEAGAVMSQASRSVVGVSPGGVAKPGTFAGELMCAGGVDPDSEVKLAARAELVSSLRSNEVPPTVAGHDSGSLTVSVTPTLVTTLGECPQSVVASHAIHSHDGAVAVPHPMWTSATVGDSTTTVSSAAPGTSLDIYRGNPKAKAFGKTVSEVVSLARAKGVSIHTAPADKLQAFVTACRNELDL